jgi:hypothetical protein
VSRGVVFLLCPGASGSGCSMVAASNFSQACGGRIEEAEKDLFVRKLMEHYPTQGDKPYQNVHLALTAVGASIA